MSKSIKAPRPLKKKPVIPTHPRFDLKWSPLKLGIECSSTSVVMECGPDDDIKDILNDKVICVRLTWDKALAVLRRIPATRFYFRPDDHDWQVLVTEAIDTTPLSREELSEIPGMSADPTPADIFKVVLAQYHQDIAQMREQVPRTFAVLNFEFNAFIKAAVHGCAPLEIENALSTLDAYKLYYRAHELMTTGKSDINPFMETVELDDVGMERVKSALGSSYCEPTIQ
jgi:hypothetical protein